MKMYCDEASQYAAPGEDGSISPVGCLMEVAPVYHLWYGQKNATSKPTYEMKMKTHNDNTHMKVHYYPNLEIPSHNISFFEGTNQVKCNLLQAF